MSHLVYCTQHRLVGKIGKGVTNNKEETGKVTSQHERAAGFGLAEPESHDKCEWEVAFRSNRASVWNSSQQRRVLQQRAFKLLSLVVSF